jgi:prevent-host-death family protein
MRWQLQEAKQRFSELVRSAQEEGPQIVTRHGEEVAVVIDIELYRRLSGSKPSFKQFLLSGPDFEDLEITRSSDLPRDIDFSADS